MNVIQEWHAKNYDETFHAVTQKGRLLLELLAVKPGEKILDLGCGTGHLTAEIAQKGAQVIGLDASETMIDMAQKAYPDLTFKVANAADFTVGAPVDAVFSNACLHWVHPPEAAVRCVARALKPGGRFVAEFGGKNNANTVMAAVKTVLSEWGLIDQWQDFWYFPTVGEYAQLLEAAGLRVSYAAHFPRGMVQEGGSQGLEHWLTMFVLAHTHVVPATQKQAFMAAVEAYCRPHLWHEDHWEIDYMRLQVVAIKP